jgi:hypothetical protein
MMMMMMMMMYLLYVNCMCIADCHNSLVGACDGRYPRGHNRADRCQVLTGKSAWNFLVNIHRHVKWPCTINNLLVVSVFSVTFYIFVICRVYSVLVRACV